MGSADADGGFDSEAKADIQSESESALEDAGQVMVITTIATLASQTSFTLTAGSADDDAYNGMVAIIEDASTAAQKAVGVVSNYVGGTKTITLREDPGIFTMAATDKISIKAVSPDILNILADTNELQTDWANGGRLDLILDEIPAETGTKTFNATALQSIQDEAEDALEGEDLDHFLKLDGATQKYPENCAIDSILAKLIAKGDPAVPSTYDNATDSLEALYDALAGGVNAVNRVAGKTQILEVSVTSAANAGNVTVATVNTQPCLINSVVLHADAAQTGDLTTAAIYAGAGNVITLIGPGDATQANLDAMDKQIGKTFDLGGVRLAATKTIVIDLLGTGATAVDLTVTIVYAACANGGYLS